MTIHLDCSVIDQIVMEKWEPQGDSAMSAVAYSEAIRSAMLYSDNGFLIAEIFAELSPRRTGGQQARDLMIAATAIARGARLATNDRRLAALDGARVPGLDPLDILYIE
jgi:predicted nucleic acid-binding protein